jgi:outer membrane lipoprotein SlyB
MNIKLVSAIAAGLMVVGFSAPASAQYRDRDRGYSDGYYAQEDGRRGDYRRGRCNSCGTVERIERENYGRGRDRDNGTGGAIVGALVGAAIGNQVGSGNGRKAATVAGAVAGGVAGKNIDKRNGGGGDEFEVVVRMDSGRTVILEQRNLNGVREGSRVIVDGGVARLR